MTEFGEKIDGLARYRRGWQAIARGAAGLHGAPPSQHLTEIAEFGTNPGQLRLLSYVPENLPRGAPLVVALHGCGQTAAGYEMGAGWSELAERLEFALLCPEQQRSNNAQLCFNWFQPGDTTRGQGEVESIRQMVERMIADHGLDRRRVFVSGLSAGGAMTSAMLATYPELFAAGAIIAGLPYGGAANVQEALESMMSGRVRSAEDWAALVRAAAPPPDKWPRVSVWHGGSDSTVAPVNAKEIVKQWQALQNLPAPPALEEVVDGARHSVWRDRRGRAVLEEFVVPGLGHGTPIAPTLDDVSRRCGVAGPFLLDAGIPSTRHIASFWGLLPPETARVRTSADIAGGPAKAERPARPAAVLEGLFAGKIHTGEVLGAARALDPGHVIERALRAAGLVKGGKS